MTGVVLKVRSGAPNVLSRRVSDRAEILRRKRWGKFTRKGGF
jgi:hypothetical protein